MGLIHTHFYSENIDKIKNTSREVFLSHSFTSCFLFNHTTVENCSIFEVNIILPSYRLFKKELKF